MNDKGENERKVTEKEGQEFANEYGLEFLESSAFTGNNIEKIFERLVGQWEEMTTEREKVTVDEKIEDEKSCQHCSQCSTF